jgi:hypothetical protein
MNSGIARRRKFCVWESTCWTGMVNGNVGFWRKKATPEIPKAKGTGIPINMKRTNRIATKVIAQSPGFQ